MHIFYFKTLKVSKGLSSNSMEQDMVVNVWEGVNWNMHYTHNHVYEEFCEAYNQGQAVELYVYDL